MTSASTEIGLYRPNVGVALFAPTGLVFWGRRVGGADTHGWQMPQGGVDEGESPEAAALRELEEETGVPPTLVRPIGDMGGWLRYEFPPEVLERKRRKGHPWIGQQQRWFAYRFLGSDSDIQLDRHRPQEFEAWRWERLERTPDLVIPWKRSVYLEMARAFAPLAQPDAGP